jgi:hypothetical protein
MAADGGAIATSLPEGLASSVIGGRGDAMQFSDAELADLNQAAKRNNEEPSAVQARHVGVTEVGRLAAAFEREAPESFVRWGASAPGEPGQFWILFTERPSPDALERIAALPTDTRVIYRARANAIELSDLSGALAVSLASHRETYTWVGTRTDRYATSITVRYVLSDEAARTEASELATYESDAIRAASAVSSGGEVPLPVVFERWAGGPGVAETVVQGGRDAYYDFGGMGWIQYCTLGFTAALNGDRGILTAKHCPSNLRYNNLSGVISTNPTNATDAANGEVDLQWHRTLTGNGHSTNKQFRAISTDPIYDRTVTDVANGGIGTVVCHWGFATGYDCSEIADVDTCTELSSIVYCGIDVTNTDVSTGGDSGGPWFYGTTARGSHSGGAEAVASYFTRIGRVANNLGATVLKD